MSFEIFPPIWSHVNEKEKQSVKKKKKKNLKTKQKKKKKKKKKKPLAWPGDLEDGHLSSINSLGGFRENEFYGHALALLCSNT